MNRFLVSFTFLVCIHMAQAQPYSITAYIDSVVIESSDYSTLDSISYSGQGWRWMFDRRIDDWEYLLADLFDVVFEDGLSTEIQVNPEFGSVENAEFEAAKYAFILGQLPACLRSEVDKVWIHQGNESFGGGFNGLLIHVGMSPTYESLGILEEVLFHEITHTSLDPIHSNATGWLDAQTSDAGFISTYGASSPSVEDLAESFLAWLMVRQCERRISVSDSLTISQTIPNRLAYFDDQNFEMYPICVEDNTLNVFRGYLPESFVSGYPNPTQGLMTFEVPETFLGERYVIFDQVGRKIQEGFILSVKFDIDLSLFGDGIYLLNIGQGIHQALRMIKL